MKFWKKIFKLIFQPIIFQKIIAYLLLIWIFFLFQNFLFIFFLTFIFGYLFLTFSRFLKYKIHFLTSKIFKNKKIINIITNFFSTNVIVLFLYLFFIWFLVYTIIDLPPKLTSELTELPKQIPALSEPINIINSKLEEIKKINTELWKNIWEIFTKQDIDLALQVFEKIKVFWIIFLKVIVSLVLSYIFIIDRKKLKIYLKTIQNSNFWFFYTEYKNIIKKIVKTFGAAFKAQSFIAWANAFLTTIWLFIIGWINIWHSYPFMYTLALIVFICGFIPFVWLFISSIPVFIIWFTMVWWLTVIIQIIVLLIIIHLIETYYLNPKIVSSMIHLPISLTFVVLLIAEHFLWFAGLIIWVWAFYLMIELLKDTDKIITSSKKTLKEIEQLECETKKSLKKDIRLSRKVED